MVNENKDILGMKSLLNQWEKSNINVELSETRGRIIDELLNVLSTTSREMKNRIINLRKRLMESLDGDESKVWDETFWDIIESDQDANNLMMALSGFTAIKYIWLWDENTANSFNPWLPESDERIIKIAERFLEYENRFVNLYENLTLEYIRKNKKIPNYLSILRKCFSNYMERYMSSYVRNIKFTEENFKEWFWVIQERLQEEWLDLEASDNIKQSFIKLCREKYPLAKKSCDFLFDSKTFKKDIINQSNKWLGIWLDDYFDDIIEWCIQDIKNDEDLSKLDINFPLLINSIINVLLNMNELMDEWTWDDEFIGLYFSCVADEFKKDHLKKLERSKEKEKNQANKTFWWKVIVTEQPKSSRKTILSDDKNDLINEAISYIDCEWKDSLLKYITKLKIKGLPLNFYDLKKLFHIEEIPPQTESILIDQLWMDYEIEEEILKAMEEEHGERTELQGGQTIVSEKIEVENPTKYLIDKLKSVWCIFDNELTARKQIDEFCQNDNYKTVLINLMTSPRFGKVFVYKSGHKTARLLRIGRTGWRILFEKKKDGNLHFVCFANHNNYEDRLAMLK